MASQMIGGWYALKPSASHELILPIEHILADPGLVLIPEHANTALCRNLIHPA